MHSPQPPNNPLQGWASGPNDSPIAGADINPSNSIHFTRLIGGGFVAEASGWRVQDSGRKLKSIIISPPGSEQWNFDLPDTWELRLFSETVQPGQTEKDWYRHIVAKLSSTDGNAMHIDIMGHTGTIEGSSVNDAIIHGVHLASVQLLRKGTTTAGPFNCPSGAGYPCFVIHYPR